MEIYVGNLAETTTEEDLFARFKPFGEVHTAHIKRELFSGSRKALHSLKCLDVSTRLPRSQASTGNHSTVRR